MRTALVLMVTIVALPAIAQVPVPTACIELAQREGFPTDTLTKTQAARARVRMARLSDRDPVVRECRQAIKDAEKASKP